MTLFPENPNIGYIHTVSGKSWQWDGVAWLAYSSGSGGGVTSYNDLTDLPTLGTAAATASTDYATAAQGAKADSALQSDALTPYRTSAAQDTIDAGKVSTTDSRLSDSRTPTSHKSSHATGGTDALTPADIGASATGHTHPLSQLEQSSATNGQVPTWDATTSTWAPQTPSGSTYVHPTGDGNQHVPATGTTNNGRVLKAGSTAGNISWGTLSLSDITQSSATLNQVATWNGTSWVPQTPASGGGSGVTSFSAGTTGLAPSTATSGAVTLSGTLALANGGTGATTAAAARTNLGVAATSHTHGNITNAGAIGTTAVLPIITGASGVLQAGSFGSTAGTFAQGNDARIASSIASAGTRTITDEQIMTVAEYAAITPNPTTLYFII